MSLPRYDAETAKLLKCDPGDVSLSSLGTEIRKLLRMREDVKIALAVRLAIAHKIITTGQTPERSFVEWCRRNVVLNGKAIGTHSIWRLVRIGSAKNPIKAYEEIKKAEREKQAEKLARMQKEAALGRNVIAIDTGEMRPKPQGTSISADVSQEMNALMTAWEHASPEARRQFLYMIGASIARRA